MKIDPIKSAIETSRLLLAICIAVLLNSTSAGSSPIETYAGVTINTVAVTSINIFPDMYKIVDADNLFTINDIVAVDQSTTKKPLSMSGKISNGTVWYITEIKNNLTKKIEWTNRIELTGIVSADLYVSDLSYSDLRKVEPTTNLGRFPVFPLHIEAGKGIKLFLRVDSHFVHQPMRITIGSTPYLLGQIHLETMSVGAYYGIAITSILFNIGLFFAGGRLRTTLYYGLFATALLVYLAAFDGNLGALFGADSFWNRNILFFAGLSVLTAIIYSRSFLRSTGLISKFRYMFSSLTVFGIIICAAALIIANIPAQKSLALTPYLEIVLDCWAIFACYFMTVAGYLAVKRRYWPALFYIGGWATISVFHSFWLLARYGYTKVTPLTYNGLHFGASVEILMMSVAVSFQIYHLRKQRTRAQESSARSEAVAQTAQMLIHDIRRPFSMIEQMLERLAPYAEASPWRDFFDQYVKTIRKQIASTKALTSNLLDVNSTQPVHCEVADLKQIVESAWQQVFDDQHAVWTLKLKGVERNTYCDSGRLQRVFINIFENAKEAMEKPGQILVSVKTKSDKKNDYLRIAITNPGSSISRDDQKKIFDVHFTKGKTKGTGLGLAICKNIVERHGGSIGVRSAKGSTTIFFTILNQLPVYGTKEATLVAATSQTNIANSHIDSKLIFLIDDCPFVRQLWETGVSDAEVKTFASLDDYRKWTDASQIKNPAFLITDLVLSDRSSIADCLENVSSIALSSTAPVFISSDFPVSTLPVNVAGILQKRPYNLKELRGLLQASTGVVVDRRKEPRRTGT